MTRLWVDANVILRFITNDPPDMAEKSAQLMAQAEQGDYTLYLSPLVLAEVIWVLKSFYRYSMADIARVLLAFISADGVEVEARTLAMRAIELPHDQNVDFADAYLALQAAQHNEAVCTFDQTDFSRLPVEWRLPG